MPEFEEEAFKTLLINRFKDTALKAFICRAARSYDSFSIQSLSDTFALPKIQLLPILTRMILKGKL